MGKKNGMPWFKVYPTSLKAFEVRASAEAVKQGLFAAIAYFEACGVEPDINDLTAGMVFDALKIGIDETLKARKAQSDAGKKGQEKRVGQAS